MKSILFTGLCAVIVFTSFDAPAKVWRYHRSRIVYRQPRPPKPPAPRILQVSGTLYSLNGPGQSLVIVDDNTQSALNFIITPQTKFIRGQQQVQPASLKAYEHVAVAYRNTDWTVKEVRLTPVSGTPAPQTGPPAKRK